MRYLEIVENRIKSYNSNEARDKDKLHIIAETRKTI
jgi:hypothetical protein